MIHQIISDYIKDVTSINPVVYVIAALIAVALFLDMFVSGAHDED